MDNKEICKWETPWKEEIAKKLQKKLLLTLLPTSLVELGKSPNKSQYLINFQERIHIFWFQTFFKGIQNSNYTSCNLVISCSSSFYRSSSVSSSLDPFNLQMATALAFKVYLLTARDEGWCPKFLSQPVCNYSRVPCQKCYLVVFNHFVLSCK
jgi:hypothetical protein